MREHLTDALRGGAVQFEYLCLYLFTVAKMVWSKQHRPEVFLELVTVPHVVVRQLFSTLAVPVMLLYRVVWQMYTPAQPENTQQVLAKYTCTTTKNSTQIHLHDQWTLNRCIVASTAWRQVFISPHSTTDEVSRFLWCQLLAMFNHLTVQNITPGRAWSRNYIQKKTFGNCWSSLPFMSPNQQCESTEGVSLLPLTRTLCDQSFVPTLVNSCAMCAK